MRIVTSFPVTATNKVDKKPLRADQWNTTDPIWFRRERSLVYEALTPVDLDRLREEFAANGRGDLLTF